MKKIILPENREIETEQGIVFVGANGAGKTRLGSWIDTESSHKNITHRVSAQKSLNMPENIRSMAIDKSLAALLCGHENALPDAYNQHKIGSRWGGEPATILMNDYEKLLVYLFSENNEVSVKYRVDSEKTDLKIEPPITKITTVQRIWEDVMPHRELIIGAGDIQARPKNGGNNTYNASKMSDGERVTFYLIGQCLSAPNDGILIIDEPELHLHKSIQYALWDRIEKCRSDCLFVYLTHDVEFAASRTGFKKIWLNDYNGKEWLWKELDEETAIPEELLLEVYGSRKKVLLVEGNNGSHDVKFYKNIFSDFLVRPCGSCENVIIYTKALRSNQSFHQLDVFGLIDKDRRTDNEISSLEQKGIFSLSVAEVENLFVTPEILKILSDHLMNDYDEKISKVKEFVFNSLEKELPFQIYETTIQELKHRLNKVDLNSKNSGTKDNLKDKVTQVIKEMNSDIIYDEVKNKFDEIIKNNDYDRLLAYYNRKSMASSIGSIFGLTANELPILVTKLSKNKQYTKQFRMAVTKYLPEELSCLINKENEI